MTKKTKSGNIGVEPSGTEVKMPTLASIQFYKRGDELEFEGKQLKVVEILEDGRLHVKNKNEPYNSFIILESEINEST